MRDDVTMWRRLPLAEPIKNHNMEHIYNNRSLKTSHHNANFVVNDGAAGCHNYNVRCPLWRRLGLWQFSVFLWYVTSSIHSLYRDHFVQASSQWETTLQCNVVPHLLGAGIKWSLHFVHAPSQWETTLQCNVVPHWLERMHKMIPACKQ